MRKHSKKIISLLFIFIIPGGLLPLFLATEVISAESYDLLLLQAFDGGRFVENLTIADLEIYAGGQKQEIKGLTLVMGSKVKRTEGEKILSPILPRVLILEYIAHDYDQKFGRMIELLFQHPYSPADSISLVASAKPYGFSSQTLRDYSPEELINAGKTILKRELSMIGRTYNETVQEMTQLILELPQTTMPRDVLIRYKQNLDNLNQFRQFNDDTLFRAIDYFGATKATKRYVVIYQQEFLPIPNALLMERLLGNPNTMFQASELFRAIDTTQNQKLNLDFLIEDLINSGIVLDFIYFKTNPRPRPEIQLKELSLDMYEIYTKIAQATGGLVETTIQPATHLGKILEKTENYYILSFAPPETQQNLELFRGKLEVKIKAGDHALTFFRL